MLNDLSTHDDRAWKSGLGQGANSLGQVVGVLAILPFVNGLTLFGDPGRAQGLLPATILFGLLALPMLLWYRENTSSTSQHPLQSWSLAAMAKEVFGYRALALLLVAYFLFSDAVITFANNFPLYLEVVHGATDTLKSTLTAAILLLAAIGAVVFGKIAQQKGTLRVLKGILAAWCLIFLAMIFIKDFTALVPVFLVAGILFGPVWALSRALVGQLAPPHLTASSFSYYVIAERFATFAGPALWSAALLMVGENVAGYNTAIFAMAILVLASLLVLRKVQLN